MAPKEKTRGCVIIVSDDISKELIEESLQGERMVGIFTRRDTAAGAKGLLDGGTVELESG